MFVTSLVDRLFAKAADDAECSWRTIRGTPVCIGDGGTIERGPKSMQGKRPDQLPKNLPTKPAGNSGKVPGNSGKVPGNSGAINAADTTPKPVKAPATPQAPAAKQAPVKTDAERKPLSLKQQTKIVERDLKSFVAGLPDGWEYDEDNFEINKEDGNSIYLDHDGDGAASLQELQDGLRTLERDLKLHGHNPELVKARGTHATMGAEWLDDREPDENGWLMQPLRSGATIYGEESGIQRWEDVPTRDQNYIRASWLDSRRIELENDRGLYSEWKSEAADEVDSTYTSSDMASDLVGDYVNEDGTDMTEDELIEWLDEESSDAKKAAEEWKEKKVDEMISGEWLQTRIEDTANSDLEYIENEEPERLLEWAVEQGEIDYVGDASDHPIWDQLGVDIDEVPSLIGAPDDFFLEVTHIDDTSVTVAHQSENEYGNDVLMTRTLGIDRNGQKYIKNDHLELPDFPPGSGARVFSSQVAAAKEAGFDYIETHAAGDYKSQGKAEGSAYVGYSVWATLGYSMPLRSLSGNTASPIEDEFPDAVDVQDIIEAPGGAEWWRNNGAGHSRAVFDLSDDSRSIRILNNYLARKKQSRDKVAAKIRELEAAEKK